ncbi:MAG TPA: S8 family serine peptidase [Pyrinomonadaceae bacterium]|nr:S8 family serine peptidase [Pyrinomonadaceae bacterium]
MSNGGKVSPAFEPFLAESGPEEKREALVVYRPPQVGGVRVRGSLRELKKRLDNVKALATTQRAAQRRLFADYKKADGKDAAGRREPFEVSTIGANTLPVARVEVTRASLSELAAKPNVVAIMPNQKVHLIRPREVDYDALGRQESKDGLTWGLKALDIPALWKKTKGADINVAVLDTGVHGEHPALDGRVKEFVVIDPLGRRVETVKGKTFDSDSHGTHVCGTVAGGKTPEGVSIGVAPEANLLVAGVIFGGATLRAVFEGVSWAVEHGADVISMSLGFTYYEPLFAEFFQILIDQYGVLPVAAIGNENYGNSSSPGNAHNALSVGAVEKMSRGKFEVAPFSSGASLAFPAENPPRFVTKPDVVAPGVQVYSCIPPEERRDGVYEYNYMDGTSMATPHVAGVAALLMAAKPAAPLADIVTALKQTAKHPAGDDPNRQDNRWGFGMIRPVEALKALG